jgi:hypothetical protein
VASERKPRKSVAFSEEATIVDSDGNVVENGVAGEKNSAESHAAGRSFSGDGPITLEGGICSQKDLFS